MKNNSRKTRMETENDEWEGFGGKFHKPSKSVNKSKQKRFERALKKMNIHELEELGDDDAV